MKNVSSAILLSCLLLGCAGTRDVSRVEPLLFLPNEREIALPIRANGQPAAAFITASCDGGTRRAVRCSHVSVRFDAVLALSPSTVEEQNRLIALLLGVSDYNCAAFTARAFGRKAQLQTANTILNSVSNALAAKSEKNKSLVEMLNLAGKTADGVFAQPSQLGSAETAVESAINAKRKELREQIPNRATFLDALADLIAYDETCSLQRGKELALQAATEAARKEAEHLLQTLAQPGGTK